MSQQTAMVISPGQARRHCRLTSQISSFWGCTHGLARDRRRGITTVAPMAELVDAPHSKCGSERSAGSIPAWGTISKTASTFFVSSEAFQSAVGVRHGRAQAHESLRIRLHFLPGFHLPDAKDWIRRIP